MQKMLASCSLIALLAASGLALPGAAQAQQAQAATLAAGDQVQGMSRDRLGRIA
jgi:hypothetical protein